jgi:uncharacterized membrane protein YgcG
MMRVLFGSTVLAILCSGCVAAPPPPPAPPFDIAAVTDFQSKPSAADPNCNDYTGQATIDGKQQQIVGHACKQPDGSWKVAEGTTDQPNQYVAVYPAPVYYPGDYYYGSYYYGGYPYDWPWLWDASFGFGSSFVFFGNHFHHHGFHGGFHGGGFHGGGFHGGGFAHGGGGGGGHR